MNMEIAKDNAAHQIAVESGAIRYCLTHWMYYRGTGDIEAAVRHYGQKRIDYRGTFASDADVRASLRSVLDRAEALACPSCEEDRHYIPVDQ